MPARRDPRSVLRSRLERIQAELLAVHGPEGVSLMGRSFGFDRLALLDAERTVTVYGWEVDLPADHDRYLI